MAQNLKRQQAAAILKTFKVYSRTSYNCKKITLSKSYIRRYIFVLRKSNKNIFRVPFATVFKNPELKIEFTLKGWIKK